MPVKRPISPGSPTEPAAHAPVSLNAQLRGLPLPPPVVLPPAAAVREALAAMDAGGVDAVVVVDPATQLPLGIVGMRDVLRRLVADDCELDGPVAAAMTGGLASLSADATVHQATVEMFRRGMSHLILTGQDGRLFNIVTQADLYGLRTSGSATLANAILAAASVDALAEQAAAVRRFAADRLAEGTGAEALCEWISALNDLLTLRLIELVEADFELPYVPWAWLVFGSEGRLEQTLVTDQDNGIIFAAPSEAAAAELRQAFLPFAEAVNAALDRCGFPLCKGGIMAGNPAWCLSLDEWRQAFHGWMSMPSPEALLNATIFFDFRPLYGHEALAGELRQWLFAHVGAHPNFLRALAELALEQEPPLSWLRDFRYDRHKDYPNTLDLKTHAIRLFVDAVRVLALAHGVEPTNTAERMRALRQPLRLSVEENGALVAGFHQIQRLRLHNQVAGEFPEAANRLNPDRLHELDRLILKEALRQAKRLQQRLRLEYPV